MRVRSSDETLSEIPCGSEGYMNGLLKFKSEEFILPNDSRYDVARALYNRKLDLYPSAIVFASTVTDVQKAILCAKYLGLKVAVRSGRHGYEGFSSGNGVFMIDVSRMKQTYFLSDDERANYPEKFNAMLDGTLPIVKAGTGLENVESYNNLVEYGLTGPLGSCPSVGLGGSALGGGIGFFIERIGLAVDSIMEYEIVDYTGQIMRVREQGTYTDLFWALNGAGGGEFGVVTAMTIQLSRFRVVTSFSCSAYAGGEKDFIETWFQTQNRTRDLSMVLWLVHDTTLFEVTGQAFYTGHYATVQDMLAELIAFCDMDTLTLSELPYADFVTTYVGSERNDWTNAKLGFTFSSTSIFLMQPLDRSGITAIRTKMANPAINYAYVLVKSMGDVVKQETLRTRSSFAYRDAMSIVEVIVVWKRQMLHNLSLSSYDDDAIAANQRSDWIRTMRAILAPYGKGAYVNYPDGTIEQPLLEYFGKNLRTLLQIKQKYDPENLFCHAQSLIACT